MSYFSNHIVALGTVKRATGKGFFSSHTNHGLLLDYYVSFLFEGLRRNKLAGGLGLPRHIGSGDLVILVAWWCRGRYE